MRFLVMGAGGVGAYFGGRLAQAGVRVAFVARGAHLEAIRRDGLRIVSPQGDWQGPVPAAHEPLEAASEGLGQAPDCVLFAVKSYDTETAARALLPALGPDSVVLCLQNGVDNEARLGRLLGHARVLGGVAYIEAFVAQPGSIEHRRAGRLVIGPIDWRAAIASDPAAVGDGTVDGAGARAAVEAIAAAFGRAGVPCAIADDVVRAKWEKLAFNAGINAMTALLQTSQGPILRCPESRAVLVAAMREVLAVGRACGVPLDDGVIERTFAFADQHDMASSMQRDRAGGRPLEAEALNGVVARLGARHDLETPVNQTLHGLLSVPIRDN